MAVEASSTSTSPRDALLSAKALAHEQNAHLTTRERKGRRHPARFLDPVELVPLNDVLFDLNTIGAAYIIHEPEHRLFRADEHAAESRPSE